jgi:histidine kinase
MMHNVKRKPRLLFLSFLKARFRHHQSLMPSDGARWIFVALSSSSIMSHRCLGAAVLPSVSLPPTENPGECDRTMEKDDLSFLDDFEYDRVEILLDLDACFERTISSRNVRQLVLLTGPSGCGKTRTAHKFGTHISEKSGGFFLSGKSDQIQKRAYAPFISAFTEFARLTEQRGPEFVECIKTKVRDSIALELTILTDMIPSLTEILGDEPATTTTDNDLRAITRTEVALVFSKFLLAISSKESPIVLFCDDMQWMDPESLDLLESLVASQNEELGWVMVLGACRSNEIAFDHPLAVHLRKVEDFGVSIINMSLDNLDRIAIQDVISGLYDLPEIANSRLSLLIQKETRGNLYLLVECLRSLHEEHILYCDPDSKEWKYNDLETRLAMGDILSFVKFKFEMLPEKAQEAVLILSCIGAEIEIVVAATLLSPDSYRSLSYPEENGLVHFDDKGARVAFAHAFVQSALYESMPESERISRHLSVGRILLSKLQKADLGGQILLVADQFKLGLSQTEDQEERHRLAAVFLCAGRKAASASGFTPAKNYLDTGISLLSSNHWVSAYALSLDLYNAAAEAALVNGDFDRTDFLIEEILDHVRTSEDKLQAETTKIYSLGARGEMLRATESGLAVLRVQGVKIPRKATTMKSALEIFRTRVRLANKSDEDLLSMPPLRDPEMTHILRMMNLILFYAYVSEPDYVLIIATQIIRLTLRYGLSDMCAFSFAIYGAILSGVMGRIKEGYRYGQLCLRLLEKSHNRGTWMARVFPCVYSIINVWCHHVEESLGPMKFAHSAALESGDIEVRVASGIGVAPCLHCVVEWANFHFILCSLFCTDCTFEWPYTNTIMLLRWVATP